MTDESQNGNPVIDPDVEQELEQVSNEEQIIGAYSSDGKNDDKTPMVRAWLPDNDEWQGKTHVTPHQARMFALARNLPKAYDEVEEMEGFIDGLITDLEMYLTSIDGMAREQQKSVLMSMFGTSGENDDARSLLTGMIAGKDGDSND